MTLEINTPHGISLLRKVEQIRWSYENPSECRSVERCPVKLQSNVLLQIFIGLMIGASSHHLCDVFLFSLCLTSVTLTLQYRLHGASVLFLRHRMTVYKGLHNELMISLGTTNLLGFWKYSSLFLDLNACQLQGGVAWTFILSCFTWLRLFFFHADIQRST